GDNDLGTLQLKPDDAPRTATAKADPKKQGSRSPAVATTNPPPPVRMTPEEADEPPPTKATPGAKSESTGAKTSPPNAPAGPLDPRAVAIERLLRLSQALEASRDEGGPYPDQMQGKLSWRVALLPHLGQVALFQKFHLNESWDSAHNIALVNEI